jgi:hypothetical protein
MAERAFHFGYLLLFLFICVYIIDADQVDVSINTNKEVFRIPRHFLSFAASLKTPVLNPTEFQFMLNSEKFAVLVKGLSPSYWRYGGLAAQSIAFHYNQTDCVTELMLARMEKKRDTPLCLTAKILDEIYSLAVKTNSMLILDLNNRVRLEDGSWNSANVRELVEYATAKKYNITWQLGNEPASYPHHFGVTVTPEQLVEDYKILQEIVGASQTVVGPEIGSPYVKRGQFTPPAISNSSLKYFQRWVNAGGEQFVNEISWHLYVRLL